MKQEIVLRLTPKDAYDEASIAAYLRRERGLRVTAVRVKRRSIDARQRNVFVGVTAEVYVGEQPDALPFVPVRYRSVEQCPQAVVVGAGPGGLFAALRLIELGIRPIIVERGKDVRTRKKDLARIRTEQAVDSESNYAFGEGGAGAYSDGKLYTRSKKRGDGQKILHVFVQHGASPSILSDAHPHIGTDCLPRVIENMRHTILDCGGEVHFGVRMEGLVVAGGEVKGVVCRRLQDGEEVEFQGPVILATGHSARDVYRMFHDRGFAIEAKGIAVGVRLEHPAHLIDCIQYHSREGRGQWLPAAEYSMVQQVDGRGVYSFCMCPGGFVVPAASGPEQIVVNGMSPSHRGGRWSNSGMVVEVRPEDVEGAAADPLRVMRYQQQMERDCWMQGMRSQTAPAQRMTDFVNGRLSADLNASSYAPGLIASPVHFWLPPFVSLRLREAFKTWGRQKRGFLTQEATVIAVETRTSSPVRILRDSHTLQHVQLRGLFPCGEGAGYAGGIVSAGVDGERCAEALARELAGVGSRGGYPNSSRTASTTRLTGTSSIL